MSEIDPTLIALFPPVFTGVFGILVGHYLTKDRDTRMRQAILDRESNIRRREFQRVVSRWRYRIERPPTPDNNPEDPWMAFNAAMAEIISEFVMCDGDFNDSQPLRAAIESTAKLEKRNVEARMNQGKGSFRQILCDKFDEIIDAARQ